MRILICHPNNDYNCGDLLTYWGTKNLFRSCYGSDCDFVQFDLPRALIEPNYVPEFNWGTVDIVALAGSPWVWDCPTLSEKYRVLSQLLARFPMSYKVALGVGSCFPFTCTSYTDANLRFCLRNSFQEIWKQFDLIVCRDWLAQKCFSVFDIQSLLCYDTSIYSLPRLHNKEKKGAVLSYHNLLVNCSNKCLNFTPEQFEFAQLDFAKKENAKVFCVSQEERLQEEFIFSCDPDYLETQYAQCNLFLSGRVHQAVLAVLAGCPSVSLIPTDSRFLTAIRFGVNIIPLASIPYGYEVEELDWKKIWEQRDLLVNEIKKACK